MTVLAQRPAFNVMYLGNNPQVALLYEAATEREAKDIFSLFILFLSSSTVNSMTEKFHCSIFMTLQWQSGRTPRQESSYCHMDPEVSGRNVIF